MNLCLDQTHSKSKGIETNPFSDLPYCHESVKDSCTPLETLKRRLLSTHHITGVLQSLDNPLASCSLIPVRSYQWTCLLNLSVVPNQCQCAVKVYKWVESVTSPIMYDLSHSVGTSPLDLGPKFFKPPYLYIFNRVRTPCS